MQYKLTDEELAKRHELIKKYSYESGKSYIVLFNKLYADGSCYYWDSNFISEPLKNKIKKYNHLDDNTIEMKYLYVYGLDLIKETIEFAIKDMKKFDMNIKLKRIEKDF